MIYFWRRSWVALVHPEKRLICLSPLRWKPFTELSPRCATNSSVSGEENFLKNNLCSFGADWDKWSLVGAALCNAAAVKSCRMRWNTFHKMHIYLVEIATSTNKNFTTSDKNEHWDISILLYWFLRNYEILFEAVLCCEIVRCAMK